ncbi:MAG: hypothetical protein NT040_01905 [Bacteroidetes bacterium]|nr:hypothetical protein [Bacteroidota bacterium]
MKKVLFCLIGSFISGQLFSQDPPAMNYWTDGTAFNIPKRRWELGLFTASRYGISDKLELSAHPMMFFLMPQVKVKAGWGEYSGFRLATEHGIFYPTLFMRLVATEGTGGLISPEFTIPQMFALSNRFLVSYRPFKEALLTAHAGITFAVKFGPLDKRTTIDLPVIYPRLAVFYNEPEFDVGIDFRGYFIPRLGWLFNIENFIICGTEENYFAENKFVLAYTSKKETLRIEAGYKLCFGKYPAGPQWHLLPVLDLVFGIGR